MSAAAANGNGHPTPPRSRRKPTLKSLAAEVVELERQRAEDFTTLREQNARLEKQGETLAAQHRTITNLRLAVDTNHLIMLDGFGQLARMIDSSKPFIPLPMPAVPS